MSNIKNSKWSYLAEGMIAEGHTPIYKMHKYFARRPQNVFSEAIRNYSKTNDVILDPFCGGGVTVVEGTALGRHVVTSDINPLATFISRCEITCVDVNEYAKTIGTILEQVRTFSDQFYSTINRESAKIQPVRWYEHAYTVVCPSCEKETGLTNSRKLTENGKEKNGWYICQHCGEKIQAVSCPHVGTEFVSVTYKTTTRETQRTVVPGDFDLQVQAQAEKLYHEKIESGEWFVPDIAIPVNWDRQQEDCLIRKGFLSFKDFFTKRSLLVNAYYLHQIKACKGKVDEKLYQLLLLTFSATIRYTNNMTISTDNWQDGRPVAWAKHAYWTSNQFVEVNPIEYIEKRIIAIKAALLFQKEKFSKPNVMVDTFEEMMTTDGGCMVLNTDSSKLPIPDESVDLVLTDPPYGGNVQYGELSAFWLAWIYDELGVTIEQITELDGEILIHRKNKVNAKTYQTYYEGLRRVYSECYRVLKKGQPMVFTFNSKDAKVWIAVQKAAIDAGFVLEPEGVIYQTPIENYKNTAHTKAAGTVHGDFIYTFVKPMEKISRHVVVDPLAIQKTLLDTVDKVVESELSSGSKTISEIYIAVLRQIIPLLTHLALSEENFDFTKKFINGDIIEATIRNKGVSDEHGLWKLLE